MATRDDIAKLAGVSSATVSRVINHKDNVSDELREKVLAAVRELDYRPNINAKGLKTNKTYRIAYIIPDVTNPYYTEIYKGINEYAFSQGYSTLLFQPTAETWYETFFNNPVDGLILAIDLSTPLKQLLRTIKIPVVHQTLYKPDNDPKEFKYKTVSHDIESAVLKIIQLLHGAKHTKIALITKKGENHDMLLKSYIKAMKKYNLPYDAHQIVSYESENYNYFPGYESMIRLIKNRPDVTAVIANNDLTAIGAMSAATAYGFCIPRDFSFIGINDSVAARYSNPSLSCVKLYKYQQGNISGRMLLDMIADKEVASVELETEFVLRKSTQGITK